MNGITAEWIGVVAGMIGIVGWVFAGIADRRAKKANKLAAEANRHAEAAVAEAVEANRVAVAANKLSEEANAVISRQAAHSVEQWLTEWRIEWDAEESTLLLTNDGRDAAHEPTVIVNGEVLRDSWVGTEPVTRGGQIRLPFPDVSDHRHEANAEFDRQWRSGLSAGFIANIVTWAEQVPVVVGWKSELGQPYEQRLNIKVS